MSNVTHISVGRLISTILNGVHLKEWGMIWSFHPANVYKGDHVMRNNLINSVSIILAMALPFIMLVPNAFGQNMESDSYQQGYGSYDTMGQDPDEIMRYGQDMMRYGFHEKGMPGGSNKYPGYNNYLNDETIKKLNAEQEAFIKATQDLRQTIYEKGLYLKAELVKKDPDIGIALSFQNNISEARGKFEQKMIEHLIRMKKINSEAESK